jgi:RNA polymerase sigma-70 factor (sigma-E family)
MADRDADFLEFVAANRGRMVRTARLLAAGDAYTAEDLVQTALTKLYVHWSKVSAADGPSRYADRALLNVFIDERKRLWRRHEISTAELAEPDPRRGPDHADRLTVLAALAELPRRQRAAVVLRYFRDLDVAAVAELMGCSEGTVKSQTARGLLKLRDLIAEPVDDLESAR